jgi:hypothetical protein
MAGRFIGPVGYDRVRTDVPWDPRYLSMEAPERVYALSELGEHAAGPKALSPMAITTPLRLLTPEGVGVLRGICQDLQRVAKGDWRTPKYVRGASYRSEFIRGLASDPTLLTVLRELAQAPLEPHPVTHHEVQLNFAPDDLSKSVDQWHNDVVSFALVIMVSDPRPMKGGRFEYFLGSVEEGRKHLSSPQGLPEGGVREVTFPGAGWAVLQQGHRILHRAAPLEESYPRITLVVSYWTPHPEIDDPTDLNSLLEVDGREIALVEWSRYAALVAARKLERFAATKTDFARPLGEIRRSLRASLSDVERTLAELNGKGNGKRGRRGSAPA